MPYEMKNLLVKGWTRDTVTALATKAHNSSSRYAGLSWGLMEEEIKDKRLERIGNTIYDTKKQAIAGFVKDDVLYNQYNFDPVVFAWIIDPLAAKFPSQSPYDFAGNKPIAFVDINGKELFTGMGYRIR